MNWLEINWNLGADRSRILRRTSIRTHYDNGALRTN